MHYGVPLFANRESIATHTRRGPKDAKSSIDERAEKRRGKTPAQASKRCILSIIMSQRNVYSSAADLAIFFRRRCDGGAADTTYVYDEPG